MVTGSLSLSDSLRIRVCVEAVPFRSHIMAETPSKHRFSAVQQSPLHQKKVMIGGIIPPRFVMVFLTFIWSEMNMNSDLARVQGAL